MVEVAIIGGGPAGFAAARALAAEKKSWHITVYERQATGGGVWNLADDGPMYLDLETNVPKEFMAFQDHPLPDELPQYIRRETIAAYFQGFAETVAKSDTVDVRYNANVVSTTKADGKWRVELADGAVSEADFLLVASGHYEHPAFPHIPGLDEFRRAHPDRVRHSVRYREPSPYTGRKVLIIGNASSGLDLTIQILRVTDTVTVSRRTPSKVDALFEGGSDVTLKPEAARFDPDSGRVEYTDGTSDVYDDVVIATGYQWRYPFLSEFNAQQKRPFLTLPDYHRLQNLHHYIFFIDDPTLAFVMVNRMIVPIPWVETQAAVIARAWSGRLQLPTADEMLAIDEELVAEKGTGENYLTLKYPDDLRFMNIYTDWVDTLGTQDGFYANRWDAEKLARREQSMPEKFLDFKRKVAESRATRDGTAVHLDLEQHVASPPPPPNETEESAARGQVVVT